MTKPYILIDGITYSAYRPRDCCYCYFWEKKKKRCSQNKCYYLLKPEDLLKPDGPPVPGRCPGCPYGRVYQCIGYCTVQLLDGMGKK